VNSFGSWFVGTSVDRVDRYRVFVFLVFVAVKVHIVCYCTVNELILALKGDKQTIK
jgi:hypothetical protein